MKLSVTIGEKTRQQTFAEVEIEGQRFLVSLTHLRKARNFEGVALYRKNGDTAEPIGGYIRAGYLRKNGIY
jgi:hypothetical protein